MTTTRPAPEIAVALRPYKRPRTITAKKAASARWSFEQVYFVAVVAAWLFEPLLRRLIDWRKGAYSPVEVVSTLPYLMTLGLAFFCLRPERLSRLPAPFKFFACVWLAVFTYGAIVAIYMSNMKAGIYEAVQFLAPMLIGMWLVSEEIETTKLMRWLSAIVITFGGIIAVYSLEQFVAPPPWDALWLLGSGLQSMGVPEPFQMRIFGTLNSSGPAGDYFMASIILSMPFFGIKRFWIWPFAGALGAALLLTLVRSSWIALLVGGAAYLIMSPRRFKAIPFIAVYAILIAFLVASLPGLLGDNGSNGNLLASRISTLGDVSHDGSAISREGEIEDSWQQALQNPLGTGLGLQGSAAALTQFPQTPQGNNLDSGYMARLLELGWGGFIGYLVVTLGSLVALILSAIRLYSRGGTTNVEAMKTTIATAIALCAALIWSDAANDAHGGLDGLIFWIGMGIGFRPLPVDRDFALGRKRLWRNSSVAAPPEVAATTR